MIKDAFLQSIREEYPNEEVTRLVFADWCIENEPELEDKLRNKLPPCNDFKIYKRSVFEYSTHGSGINYGYGLGFGYCYGASNYYLDDDRVESHLTDFNVSKFGFRENIGISIYDLRMPKLHENQMIFLPFGLVFCGYVKEQIDPYAFRITDASLIYDNFYHPWQALADNEDLRKNVGFNSYGEITIGPQNFISMDWKGDLP